MQTGILKAMRTGKQDKQTIKRILHVFQPYKGYIVIVCLMIIVISILGVVNPLVSSLIFDDAIPHRNLQHLIFYVSIMLFVPLISGLIGISQGYFNNRIGQYIMRDIRSKLYHHLQQLSFRFFTASSIGETQSRLSNDVNGIQGVVTDTLTQALTIVATTISIVVAMAFISPLLTLLSLVIIPFFIWATQKVGNIGRRIQMETQMSMASLSTLMQETLSISGVLLIKTFGRHQMARERFEQENQQLTQLEIHQQVIIGWFMLCLNVLFSFTPIIVYSIAGWQLIQDPQHAGITIGEIIAFVALQSRLLPTINQLFHLQIKLVGSLALFDRIFEYMDIPIEICNAPNAVRLSPTTARGELRFRDVSFRYIPYEFHQTSDPHQHEQVSIHDQPPVPSTAIRATLSSISFSVQPGQLVALVGPSGAGKTTVAYLVPRLYDVEDGAIEIDGVNVKDITLESLSDIVGIVTQETFLFHATVRENLLYVRPEATEQELIAATKAAVIHERIMELEQGYDTTVGERGYKLSGGEKQRLAIARVLLKDPRILILDEATSSLDTKSERMIQSALEPLMKSRTTLAIAHRLSTILAADLILVLNEGRIVEQGTHQQLLAHNSLYAQLYYEQFATPADVELPIK